MTIDYDQIKEERKAKNVPEECRLITDQYDVNEILEHIGFDHNPESIVLEDSFHALFVNSEGGQYTEVWGVYESVVMKESTAYRIV